MAALRTGANVSEALVSEGRHAVVAGRSPNLLAGRYPGARFDDGAADRALELADWVDALVVGPGLVDADEAALERTVSAAGVPTVVDADAIVADGERSTNDTGTSVLSVAGTGDPMTGIALLVRGLDRAEAAEVGA